MKVLIFLLLAAMVVNAQNILPFMYLFVSVDDPAYIAKIRYALSRLGLDPNGIRLVTLQEKYEIFRTAYKAAYVNQDGQKCYIKWHENFFVGGASGAMPSCEYD